MSLTRQHRQEDLSIAYISAVAAKAGFNCGRTPGHDYGIDVEIGYVEQIGDRRVNLGHILHIQAKASQNFRTSAEDNCIVYDLDVNAYNMLILQNRGTPALLVLYCMPTDENEWVSVDEQYIILKNCGYWISLRGRPASTNIETQSIKIPREQVFTESALKSIMERIKSGERL
jgi:hypothetical protein